MYRTFLSILLLLQIAATAGVSQFRIEQDLLWLQAEDEPLPAVLERFAAVGVDVCIDPGVRKPVSGAWMGEDLEQSLAALIAPYDYLLDWRRESGPLGSRTVLTGIRVYRKGFAADARPLRRSRCMAVSTDGRFRYIAREILIGFGPGASMDDLHSFLARTGGSVIKANSEFGIYRVLLPESVNVPELAEQLANDPALAFAEPNYIHNLPDLLPGAGTAAKKTQWTPPEGGSETAVSVLDSGLVPNAALNAALLSTFDATRPDAPLTADAVGHGTLMARIAAGLVDPYNTPVGEGVPVVAVKAFADDGSSDSFTLMSAMAHAVENSSGPVSLSWGTETPSRFIQSAVTYVRDSGSPVFAAVGNENTGTPMYPAAYPGVIGVAAGTSDGQYTGYSNRGDFVDLIAPGSAGGSQGTSVATAYVSHVAGLYMQHNPDVTADQTVAALLDAAGPDRYLSQDDALRFLAR